MAQTARHPSVDITDTTPAHTAATLRPDRHHTHGHQVAIVGWRLYEAYGRIAFVAISSPTAHNQAEISQLCTLHMCLRAQFQSHAAGKPTAGGVRDKSKRSCLRFPTSPAERRAGVNRGCIWGRGRYGDVSRTRVGGSSFWIILHLQMSKIWVSGNG